MIEIKKSLKVYSMKVLFIKDHFTGIKKGDVKELATDHAQRLIEESYCEEVTEKKRGRKKKED
jgi:hypothetical protein